MPSKAVQTKERQKTRYTELAQERESILREKGIDDAHLAKDSKIKHFKAKVKQINSALTRIAFLDEQNQKLQEKKEQKKAEAAAARAAMIAGEVKKKTKKEEEPVKAPAGKKKGAAKAPAGAKGQQPKKKGK